jgi:ribonuclease D
MFVSEISREEINLLTIRHFGGKIHLIDTIEKFDAAYPQIMQHRILGFDTETRPSFKKGKVYNISLIQLSSTDEAWLIRINRIGIPTRLRKLMENREIIKIGAGLNDDFNKIRDFGSLEPGGFIDLQKYVEEFDIESKSLKKLTAIILGFKISITTNCDRVFHGLEDIAIRTSQDFPCWGEFSFTVLKQGEAYIIEHKGDSVLMLSDKRDSH